MSARPVIVAVRHWKEKRSKCSLRFIEGMADTVFLRSKPGFRYDGSAHLLLSPDAPVLCPADAFLTMEEEACLAASGREGLVRKNGQGRALRPVLLLDSVWRLLPGMRAKVDGAPLERSLPGWIRTAYPRVSKMTEDPEVGLATIEALYAALWLMGMDCGDLLEGYLWKETFLAQFDEVSRPQ